MHRLMANTSYAGLECGLGVFACALCCFVACMAVEHFGVRMLWQGQTSSTKQQDLGGIVVTGLDASIVLLALS